MSEFLSKDPESECFGCNAVYCKSCLGGDAYDETPIDKLPKPRAKTNFEVITESVERLAEFLECPIENGCDEPDLSCYACKCKWLNSPAEIAKNDNNGE